LFSIVIPLQNEKGEKGEACGERGEAYAGGEFLEKVAHGVPLRPGRYKKRREGVRRAGTKGRQSSLG